MNVSKFVEYNQIALKCNINAEHVLEILHAHIFESKLMYLLYCPHNIMLIGKIKGYNFTAQVRRMYPLNLLPTIIAHGKVIPCNSNETKIVMKLKFTPFIFISSSVLTLMLIYSFSTIFLEDRSDINLSIVILSICVYAIFLLVYIFFSDLKSIKKNLITYCDMT